MKTSFLSTNFPAIAAAAIFTTLPWVSSCGTGGSGHQEDTVTAPRADEYHADYDIAMTVLSATDALRVGEPLDSTGYNYDGILTDGQGHPLYTNLHGVPGRWEVDALTDSTLTIRNTDLGDLMATDLEGYITQTLGLTESDILEAARGRQPSEHYSHIYGFEGGRIRFEVHNVTAQNGLEAPMMIITVSR